MQVAATSAVDSLLYFSEY